MRRFAPILALSLLLPLCVPVAAIAQDGERPDCIEVRAIARWAAAAYNHFVRVENRCDRAATCQVSTNVSPEPHRVTVPPGEHVEVITFRGSPAREFTPRVTCTLAD